MILRYALRRLGLAVVTMFAVSVITFLLFFAAPASPADLMCGRNCQPDRVAAIKHQLELDRPVPEQYARFVSAIFVGRTYGDGELAVRCPAPCLGYSYRFHEPVTDVVARSLPITLSVVGGSAVIWLGLGVFLGVLAARYRGTRYDRFALGVSLVASSTQVFFLGMILLLVFRYTLGWVGDAVYVSPFDDVGRWMAGMILPWATLGLLFSAGYIRLVRARMLDTLHEDYIRTARATGLRDRTIYYRHALRASLSPLVTLAGLDVGAALGGTVLTETVFSLHGLGREAVDAVVTLNLPVVMATVLLGAFFIIVANLVVDVLYAAIDPRVKLG